MIADNPIGSAPVLQLHPSRLCNLACRHCYSSSGPDARGALPIDLLTRCIGDAHALGYRRLAVSGGEPLLYPQLEALLACARGFGMAVTMTSNGMLATAQRWRPLAPLVDALAISIDGTPAEHDALRGHAGAFARTLANLGAIRASGVPFGFLFTLTRHNVDSLEFVVRLALEHGARGVQVHPLTATGRAAAGLEAARPDAIELGVALFEAMRLGESCGIAVGVDALTLRQAVCHRERLVPARPVRQLADVAPVLVVDADANVLPLTHDIAPALWLGTLAQADLRALAGDWLADGRGDALAAACARAWDELTANWTPSFYWYDEVAARTH